jgi:catalase
MTKQINNLIKLKSTKIEELITSSGWPYSHNEESMSAGPKEKVSLEDYCLHEKSANFNHLRI